MTMLLPLILVTALQAAASAAPSPVQLVSREMMSMVDEPRQAVARTAPEWAALWRQHAGAKAMPPVDLSTRTVVAVFLGTRPSPGFSADITGIRQVGGGVVVEWQERRPQRGDISAQVLTSPAVIVTIPKVAGEIIFEKVER
jgi:hypothetical protein